VNIPWVDLDAARMSRFLPALVALSVLSVLRPARLGNRFVLLPDPAFDPLAEQVGVAQMPVVLLDQGDPRVIVPGCR
jgi:hypothetical protein